MYIFSRVLLLSFLTFSTWFPVKAQSIRASSDRSRPTIIYLTRHAEKVTLDPNDQDPLLTPEGYRRAEKLKQLLDTTEVTALFTTPFQRNRLTLTPLAEAKKLPLQTYQAQAYSALVKRIRKGYRGKTVVVAGHSNSVLEIIEALGPKRPIATIQDGEYDFLFRVTLPQKGAPAVEVLRYGLPKERVEK